MAKIFVLDTNIILHDHQAIKHFQDNDLVIPIAVIEELDKFKKGNDALSYNARAFMREINKLTDKKEFGPKGIPLRICSAMTSRTTGSCPRPCGCGTTTPGASSPW